MPSDSPLDQQRDLVARMRAELERQALILEGMERMAAFAAPVVVATTGTARAKARTVGVSGATSKGRQPGAISKRWRAVFSALIAAGNHFDDEEVVETVFKLEQRAMRRSEVRRLFENHRANDLVAFNDDGTYSVTQHAIDKFDLGRNEEGPTARTEGPSDGGVAERLIASDSNSDGASLLTAPVGSNPAASAPSAEPWGIPASLLASTSTANPPSEA